MKKRTKRLISILLAFIMIAGLIPSSAFAWDEYIECEFCGEGCGDDYICSCGDHCSEDSGRDCYKEHHCIECGDVAELCGGTGGCGRCYDCGGTCSEGEDHQCLECHIEEQYACPDCGFCWITGDSICPECLGCYECLGYCSEGDDHLCLECHLSEGYACPECAQCYVDYNEVRCVDCNICNDCAGLICPECYRCDGCVEICYTCGEICTDCHEANGDACPDCGMCYGDEIYCQECGRCYNCENICPDCELCAECYYGTTHCTICGECFEANGQCESGGDHCADCCESNGWLCPNCGECTEVSGVDLVCNDCGACADCSEFCDSCGDFCMECLINEEHLHCTDCEACFEEVWHCADCYLCENCVVRCETCWDYCMDCADLSGYHCKECGVGCINKGDSLCSKCGRCEYCADYCEIHEKCIECAVKEGDHCDICGNCFMDYYGCPSDSTHCEECCIFNDWLCGHCGLCTKTDGTEICEHCGFCTECCQGTAAMFCGEEHGVCIDSPEWAEHWATVHEGVEHECNYRSTDMKYDDENHWYECAFPGCETGKKFNVNPHEPDENGYCRIWTCHYRDGSTKDVIFDGNGGVGVIPPLEGIIGDYILPVCKFNAPEGKKFKGWEVNGVMYAEGDKITVTDDTVLKAVWDDTAPDYTPGDVNGDNKVNLADVSLLLKHIAKWSVVLNLDAADVTGDGKVNLADVSLMLKYIAKWDVVFK